MRKWLLALMFLGLASPVAAELKGQFRTLHASDAAPGDLFGTSVAVSSNLLVVGAPEKDILFGTPVESMGAAYVFGLDHNNEWVERERLTPIDGATPAEGDSAGHGTSVALSGGTVFAGAPGERAVYVYVADGSGGWPHFQKIESPGSDAGDQFGRAVAASGGRLIVGANEAAYFYEYQAGAKWALVDSHEHPGPPAAFGSAVAIDGERAVIGALNEEYLGVPVGAAHVFGWNGEKWVHETVLREAELGAGYEYGHSVAIAGDQLLVSASRFLLGGGAGKAYVYERVTGVWQLVGQLSALDEEPSGEFGWAVALQDEVAVVADNYYDGPALNTGRAYVFTPDGAGGWEKDFTLEADDAALADYLGGDAAISGETVVVGATGDDDAGLGAGAVYLFLVQIEEDPLPVPSMGGLAMLLLVTALLACTVRVRAGRFSRAKR